MRDFSQDHRWRSINTATVRKSSGQDWPLDRIIDACARRGIRAISPWRDQVAAVGLEKIARPLRDAGMQLPGHCRGGFYPAVDAAGGQAALDDTRRAIDEAKTLNAPGACPHPNPLPRGEGECQRRGTWRVTWPLLWGEGRRHQRGTGRGKERDAGRGIGRGGAGRGAWRGA